MFCLILNFNSFWGPLGSLLRNLKGLVLYVFNVFFPWKKLLLFIHSIIASVNVNVNVNEVFSDSLIGWHTAVIYRINICIIHQNRPQKISKCLVSEGNVSLYILMYSGRTWCRRTQRWRRAWGTQRKIWFTWRCWTTRADRREGECISTHAWWSLSVFCHNWLVLFLLCTLVLG